MSRISGNDDRKTRKVTGEFPLSALSCPNEMRQKMTKKYMKQIESPFRVVENGTEARSST